MCGINGLVSDKLSAERKTGIIRAMDEKLAHRGPDSGGEWNNGKVFFGHRRLSVIDLNSNSDQPLLSADKKYAIVYNGELYNYRELKLELQRTALGSSDKPYFFTTSSDTEVILAAYMRWGSRCLEKFSGMFAFAIADPVNDRLFIARDRLGVKPLYYYHGEEGFVFSSEIRPILDSGIKRFRLNKKAVAEYAMYQTVHAPSTIVEGIQMLMPGTFIELHENKPEFTKYYTLDAIPGNNDDLSYDETCRRINELLCLSVQKRLVSDVPFGAFLSGGIDSSAVVGIMSKVSSQKVRTFNVTFDESEFSEARYARLVSKKFGTEHHEIVLRPDDFLSQLPEALSAMDHPGGDGPNTYVVSKATKQAGITVALSGIGGDELFAGYGVFTRMASLKRKAWIGQVPRIARKIAGAAVLAGNPGTGGKKISELLGMKEINFVSAYLLSRSLFSSKEFKQLFPGTDPYGSLEKIVSEVPQVKDHLFSAVSLAEIKTYLQNVLLRDTDQMSMASALEVREPFLDHQLVEFALSVKDSYKYPSTPKKLLCDSLGDLLPSEIINRPKMGFTLPWQHWMKNQLSDFCEKNIRQFSGYEFCDKDRVHELWKRFITGDASVSWSRIWHLVVLNNWMNENQLVPD